MIVWHIAITYMYIQNYVLALRDFIGHWIDTTLYASKISYILLVCEIQ